MADEDKKAAEAAGAKGAKAPGGDKKGKRAAAEKARLEAERRKIGNQK